MTKECMRSDEFNWCCCNCRYHLMGYSFSTRRPTGEWVCIAFVYEEGEPIAYLGVHPHGICELHAPIPRIDNKWEI